MSRRLLVKEYVRNHVPDTPLFQKMLAKARLKELSRYDEIEKAALSSAEQDSPAFKKEIVESCFRQWPQAASKCRSGAEKVLSAAAEYQDRDVSEQVMTDVLYSFFALGYSPEEYVSYHLEDKTVSERLLFLGDRKRIKYHAYLDNLIESSIFTDKIRTYRKFSDYFKRDVIEIGRDGDFPAFESFVRKHPCYVRKNVYASCGRAVSRVDSESCGMTVREQFDDMRAQAKHVVEELIVQSDAMAQFNQSSVNTVRCITMNTKNGVQVPFGFFRVGAAGSFVDNAGSGGISSGIDMARGIVETDGKDESGQKYSAHPGSGAVFKGFEFPDWEQLLDIAHKVASMVPGVRTVGWDFAHTDGGWVMVEGNAMSQIGVLQIPYERGMAKEFESYFKDMDPIIPR